MIEGISIIGLTPSALLLIAVLMVLTGRLIPRSMYMEKVKESEQWHAAYEVERTARAASDAQTRELMELAKTGTKLLEALPNNEMIQSGDA